MTRWFLRGIAALAGLSILLAIVGALYQVIATRLDAHRHPEPGRLVDAGGYRLNLHCTGTGVPAVILEAGLGDIAAEWNPVQPEIAKFSRVCSYDRAGYGGSDPGILPRTSLQIAKELHTLLRNAREAPPFVLVGHSFGGYNVRVYSGLYPEEVAGMVLVDSTQEDQYALLPATWKEIGAQQLRRYQSQAAWSPIFIGLGIARLTLQRQGALNENSYLILQAKYLKARASELAFIETSAQQARAAGSLGSKPLVVLTAGANSDAILSSGLSKEDFEAFQRIWVDDLQPRLAHLSSRGERVLVPDSGHDIPAERPDAIVSAVRKMRDLSAPRPSPPSDSRIRR